VPALLTTPTPAAEFASINNITLLKISVQNHWVSQHSHKLLTHVAHILN